MPELVIRNEHSGQSWQVWPEVETIPAGAIRETGSYLFELYDSADNACADLLIDEVRLEALRATEKAVASWRWMPGFQAGTVEAELRLPGQGPRRFEIVTDPDLRKMTRRDFDQMVRAILDDTFALFSLTSFRKGIAKGDGKRPPPIARLEYLRSKIHEMEEILAVICRNPRRILLSEEVTVPYHQARHATGPEILRSFRTGHIHSVSNSQAKLPAELRGFLPDKIRLRKKRNSIDLPEHRQMAACLRSWASWLAAVAELLEAMKNNETQSNGSTIWASRCRKLARRVSQFASSSPFSEAGDAMPVLHLSGIFRNDPAYQRFFRLYQDLNLGIASVFGDFLQMPLSRTYDLYELWCFLRLVRAATQLWGHEGLDTGKLFNTDAQGGLTLSAGSVTVPVGQGWLLCFQKQYREFWQDPERQGSFSRTMTPDIVLIQTDAEGSQIRVIVLDAKYRIEEGLNAALSSTHMYRDAIVKENEVGGGIQSIVSGAYLLAPQSPDIKDTYPATPMPGRLFHPDYRKAFRFGALSLHPGMTLDDIEDALRIVSQETEKPQEQFPQTSSS
jgi:hypothetical protein